ncbi:MAG: 3-carboxy-cis,cis-muconate cycloisomerase [Sneathiella sp.]|nr:3-carboxy-cis,cis-muconate cycloisomerase [Sneathiella sp.]
MQLIAAQRHKDKVMTVSPFDHPYLSGLFGNENVVQLFSAENEIREMLNFEAALAAAEGKYGIIPAQAVDPIGNACCSLRMDWENLRDGTAADGVVVPTLIRQLRSAVGAEFGEYVHFGATSQDAIDTSLILRLKKLFPILVSSLNDIIGLMEQLDQKFGTNALMGRTRMQRALPVTASQRFASWSSPLAKHLESLNQLAPNLLQVQFGGAVGNLNKLGDKGLLIKEELANILGIESKKTSWHTDRHTLADFSNWLSMVSGSLGKMGQDVVLMAQNEIGEITLKDGGGSSAMPHKQNPVQGEVLVTLSRFNAVQISAMHQALIHENERSGSSWSLEWMILPQMVMATAASLKTASALLSNIQEVGTGKN